MQWMRHNALGIYISIPFCRSKCTYCNFASGVYPAAEHERYINRLVDDMADSTRWAENHHVHLPRAVNTIYLGGGTPSLLAPVLIHHMFHAMRTHFDVDPAAEITVECAPGQIAPETVDALACVGVNRVSLGVQSFIDREAHASGRLHNRATVLDDLRRLRSSGITNLNIDLIAGLPGQTFDSWEESISVLLDTGVPHASIYMLEVDEDSRLGREVLAGGARYHAGLVPSDDAIARMYETAIDRLDRAGLRQYEISNFSQAGFESRHNLRYWQRRPYLGLGLDASSALYESTRKGTTSVVPQMSPNKGPGFSPYMHPSQDNWALQAAEKLAKRANTRKGMTSVVPQTLPDKGPGFSPSGTFSPACLAPEARPHLLRFTTTNDLRTYLDSPEPPETARLSPARQLEEAWFLGLRLNAGIDFAALEAEFGPAAVAPGLVVVERLVGDGLLSSDGNRVRLTSQGRLLSNEVFQQFLDPVPA